MLRAPRARKHYPRAALIRTLRLTSRASSRSLLESGECTPRPMGREIEAGRDTIERREHQFGRVGFLAIVRGKEPHLHRHRAAHVATIRNRHTDTDGGRPNRSPVNNNRRSPRLRRHHQRRVSRQSCRTRLRSYGSGCRLLCSRCRRRRCVRRKRSRRGFRHDNRCNRTAWLSRLLLDGRCAGGSRCCHHRFRRTRLTAYPNENHDTRS